MAHWVMIEMAKLSKEKRARIKKLLEQDKCCDCEKGKPTSRWNCPTCLGKLYAIKKFGDPITAAKYESSKVRQGKLAPPYNKEFSAVKHSVKKKGA